ncbi:hypothetical protein EsDP_00006037 [Epichloe bromicola]|uniref:Uncharacterized protein n=1 Tax=Epichloe bromicola TaxID=79588 RepID=A0ABQ0CWG1_9HYPO
MASKQIRKRRIGNDIAQNNHPAKKRKSTSTHVVAPKFPPAFYDELSEIPLTLNVLLELDQRNDAGAKTEKRTSSVGSLPKDLPRFSRRGGPDLQRLRNFSSKTRNRSIMENTRSSSRSRQTQSTRTTNMTSRSGSSRYGKEFEQHLRDHGVYMNNRKSKPLNTEEARARLEQSRASLSPSQFTAEQFETFQRKNEDVVFESDVMADVIPIICGSCRIPSKQNVLFTELAPLTTSNAVRPKPDHFDGANLEILNVEVRNDSEIKQNVIPTKHPSVPVAANFFIEAKGPDGNASVAHRQACYDGAYGARAMHALQNYGKSQPEYDGNAYTYSSTYHPATGTLQLYAHHVTAPSPTGERQEYHMTPTGAYALTHSRESFVQGAAAFRNARDTARRHRDHFIQAANSRHLGRGVRQQDEDWQDAHDSLQGQSTDACDHNPGNDPRTPDALQSSQTDDETPNPSQAPTILGNEDLYLSLATSLTSSFGNEPISRSKRARNLTSPDNSWGRRSSKSRARVPMDQLAVKGPTATESFQSPNPRIGRQLETESRI